MELLVIIQGVWSTNPQQKVGELTFEFRPFDILSRNKTSTESNFTIQHRKYEIL